MLNLIHGIAALGSLGLLVYLAYALCRPENF
jgi:K+-transporting ATPase KdpF subunit